MAPEERANKIITDKNWLDTDRESVQEADKDDLLRRALEYLVGAEDEGPHGQGWKSDKLVALIREIQEVLNVPPDERY